MRERDQPDRRPGRFGNPDLRHSFNRRHPLGKQLDTSDNAIPDDSKSIDIPSPIDPEEFAWIFSRPMNMDRILKKLRANFSGFRSPADTSEIEKLTGKFRSLPVDVHRLYLDHDGQELSAHNQDTRLPSRLMPIAEAIETNDSLASIEGLHSPSGRPAYLWTDDDSNYGGVFTVGPLQGWVTILHHESQSLVPSFRCVNDFYRQMFASAPGLADEDTEAVNLSLLPRQFPLLTDDRATVAEYRALVKMFSALAANETDEDVRRIYAKTAICLTPVVDTASVSRFFQDSDMWIPESAVCLIEFRKLRVAIPELEQLAMQGHPNGDGAAMRTLVRMSTSNSLAAIDRLKKSSPAAKLQILEQWIRLGPNLTAPHWQ